MSGQAMKSDVAAREALDRVLLAVAQRDPERALEACAMVAELARAGYRLSALGDPTAIAARAVRMRAQYDGLCAACGAPVRVDDPIFWTRGVQGVECAPCGGRA